MRLGEMLVFALRGVGANKLRSALTTLGILIGVAAVIVLVAVGNGTSAQVASKIEGLGTNTLTVLRSQGQGPGAAAAGAAAQVQNLTVANAAALAAPGAAPAIHSVSPVVAGAQVATFAGTSHTIPQFVGTYPSWFAATNSPVSSGTYFTNSDVLNARKVMVIGQTVQQDLFGTVNPVGKQVTVGGVPFTVVGVLKTKGSVGFANADDVAVAPLSTVQQSLTGYGSLTSIVVQATSASTVNAAQAQITNIMDQQQNITNPALADYRILNEATLLAASSATTGLLTVLLGAVAALSLLVGGIGITNIMLVTVTERTREIGIRKAIGAPRAAILGQFLIEATVLSLVGATAGALIGIGLSQLPVAGIHPVVSSSSIILAFGVSVAIGLFFGSYPASRAARLRPIEALRHE